MDDFSAESENQQDNEASASNTRKRDRKPTLTPDERHERKIPRDRGYRKGKKEEGRVLEERIVALEEMNKEQQSDIDFLKEELSKITARADELARKLNDESENLKEVKMAKENLESDQMRQLQQKILNQEHRVENLDIPWDDLDRNKILEGFTENSDPLRSKTPGSLFGEGTSSGLSTYVEVVNIGGFSVLKENSAIIQKIFHRCPNFASGFQVRRPATKNGFINLLAEVYKMARKDQHTRGNQVYGGGYCRFGACRSQHSVA